jgi:hypothetical protein
MVKKLEELWLWFLVEQEEKEAPFSWDGSPESLGTHPLMATYFQETHICFLKEG